MAKITDRGMRIKPGDKDIWISETLIWGHGSLSARIRPNGERIFYLRYYSENKARVKLPLGVYGAGGSGTLTLSEARVKGMELASLHESGVRNIKEYLEQQVELRQIAIDSELTKNKAEQAALEAQVTVEGLFEHWAQVVLVNRKDGGAEIRRMFDKDVLPIIGDIYVADVKKGHITLVTDKLLARQVNNTAKRALALMRQMFRFAVDRDIIEHDPTASLRKASIGGKTVERDRILSEDEIQSLAMKLPKANLLLTSQTAVWLSLSTCCRIGELLSAKWEHLNFDKGTWTIPPENSKNGKLHTVYLSEFSKQQFLELKRINGGFIYCYPNRAGDNHICTKTVTRQLSDRQKQGEQEAYSNRSKHKESLVLSHGGKWTPHDLRRTGATLMTALGVLPEVAERCLNHTDDNKVRRIYQRYSYQNEMAEAWRLLGEHITKLIYIK